MYQLVAVDLDGTLLDRYGEVTEYTKKIIKKTMEKGIDVMIASGRPYDSVKTIAKEIESNCFYIAGNGALVFDIQKDEVIYEKSIPKSKMLDMIRICEENSIFFSIYTNSAIIAKNLNYNVLYYHKENLKKEESKMTHINLVENVYEYVKSMEQESFLKMTICDQDQSIFQSIIRKLREIEEIEVLDVSHISRKLIRQGTEEIPIEYYYTEISSKNVDKWTAIEFLLEKLNLSKEEVMTIGDNINDKNMIQKAGLGIAMGQSSPEIISVADEITEDNDSNGVAKALEKWILS